MRVSLYIPCFNVAKTIGYCLDAVFNQTRPLKEVLVVDDCSTDNSPEIVSSYPVRLIRHKTNRGIAASRNTAIKNTDSEFIASLDADCVPEPDFFEDLIKKIDSPKIAGAGGRLLEKVFSVCDLWRSVHMRQHWGEEEAMPHFLFGSNTVFRREALLKAGLYNEDFKNNYEDVDMCERIRKEGYIFVYEPKAVSYHFRKDNIYSLFNNYWRWYLEYYQKENFYSNHKRLTIKLKDNIGLANRYIEEDISSGKYQLIYLDFLLALHHSLKDFEYFIYQNNEEYRSYPPLSSWLTLLDLTFFYHFDSAKDNFSTLIPKQNALLQNLFALYLILGRFIREKFIDDEFERIFHSHLLFSIYKIRNDFLLDNLLMLIELQQDWSQFFKKRHPHLNVLFLENLFFSLEKWLNQLSFNHSNILGMIESSAKETDKLSYTEEGGREDEVR